MNVSERNRVVEQHYRANYNKLVSQSKGILGSNSEDAIQEAYVRAIQYWPSFDAELGSFDEWFSSILRNARKDSFIDTLKHGATDGVEVDSLSTPAPQYPRMRLEEINKYLGEYPPDVQRCLRMALVDRYSHGEITQVLPFTVTNIKKLINRFRHTLQDAGV